MNNNTWTEAYWDLLIRMNGTFILIIFYKEVISAWQIFFSSRQSELPEWASFTNHAVLQ